MANSMKSRATLIIGGAIALIIGLILLPLMANFVAEAKKTNRTGVNENWVGNISGLGSVLDLVVYGFCFGLVGLGVGMIYIGYKKD